MRWSAARIALVGADGFVALTSLGGGIAMAAGLEDDHLGRDLLDGTPFNSFLMPGVLLATVVGGSASAATVATLRQTRHAGCASAFAGAVLAAWILGEIAVLKQPDAPTRTELFYLTAAALMTALGTRTSTAAGTLRERR